MPPRPADLDARSLTDASGTQLDFWIEAANKTAGKKELVKTGRVDVRRHRLADYYGIDLSNIPAAPALGPISRDKAINENQWAHLRRLGVEWAAKDASRGPFRLVGDATQPNTFESLNPSEDNNSQTMDLETVQALLQSAKDGDNELPNALTVLSRERPSALSRTLPNIPSSDSNLASTSSTSSAAPASESTALPSPAPPVEPLTSLDSIILASGSLSVQSLKRANGLREVVTQLENGQVAEIRELYGPKKDRATNLMWGQIKNTITRRERLGNELQNEFKGNKDKFFAFFTITETPKGKRGKSKEAVEKLRSLRLVSQAIPHRDKDLRVEQSSVEYQCNGVFSEELWTAKWDGKNKWEVWRTIDKERY
ncbi:hypothetical protein C8R43DRAFT_874734 [Mycena crocata]|nr:hypothetical protein C8R43DRAFT_874734 [Mycena crocata]